MIIIHNYFAAISLTGAARIAWGHEGRSFLPVISQVNGESVLRAKLGGLVLITASNA